MPKYRVLARSYINNAIREEGDIVEYDGPAGSALELIGGAPAVAAEAPVENVKPQKGFARKAAKAESN